jgi:hypothetical protein
MSKLLFGVAATDPGTYAAVAALAVSDRRCRVLDPARRAVPIDPISVLREE